MQTPEAAAQASAGGSSRLLHGLASAERILTRVAERPLLALAGLAAAQWLLILAFALTVRHNGWIYYQGGDQIWLSSTSWLLGENQIPPAYVGYGWPLALAPLLQAVGPDYVSAMPPVILVDVLVLGPLALWAVHGLAERIAGRVFALVAASAWVVLPYAVIPLWRQDYHERYVEQFLPGAVGLTGMADFPSMVLLAVGALLFVRALDRQAWAGAAAAGLVVGFAIAVKPSNALFLGGPALAALVARNLRPLVPFGLALLPAVLTLAVWKQRGLGAIPVFDAAEARTAAAAVGAAVPDVGRYFDLDWSNLHDNMSNIREYFWSARLVQWAPLAGLVGLARRSPTVAALAAAWFAAFLVAKGTTPLSTVSSGSFFRLLMPAFPAYFLLAASTLLLVPRLGEALARRWPPGEPREVGQRTLVGLGAALAVVPLAVILLVGPMSTPPRTILVNNILTPVDERLAIDVRAEGPARELTWTHPALGSSAVFYRVYRTDQSGEDVACVDRGAARECLLKMVLLGTTREPRWRDGSPPPGSLYRVGVAANAQNDENAGDVVSISRPTRSD
ncbi:MAG: hypothetical protein HOQ03_12130 [Thermoleophilia bacterium]|nr:hypothetical protein [Thermoleophilia bacterium]